MTLEVHPTKSEQADADFGHPYLTDFGQHLGGRLWPYRLWPTLVFWSFGPTTKNILLKRHTVIKRKKNKEEQTRRGPRGPSRVEAPKGGEGGRGEGGRGEGCKISRFFFFRSPLLVLPPRGLGGVPRTRNPGST